MIRNLCRSQSTSNKPLAGSDIVFQHITLSRVPGNWGDEGCVMAGIAGLSRRK
jgi:hypothetical protein